MSVELAISMEKKCRDSPKPNLKHCRIGELEFGERRQKQEVKPTEKLDSGPGPRFLILDVYFTKQETLLLWNRSLANLPPLEIFRHLKIRFPQNSTTVNKVSLKTSQKLISIDNKSVSSQKEVLLVRQTKNEIDICKYGWNVKNCGKNNH